MTRIMRSKNCTVLELTKRMGLKSVNTISRLMTDKSGSKKITAFCEDLCRQNPLMLLEREKRQLFDAAEVSLIGVDTYTANQQMLSFVQARHSTSACVCTQAFGTNSFFIASLDDLFESYAEFSRVDILLQGCTFPGVIRALKLLLENSASPAVRIEQYVNASESRAQEIQDFLTLLDVMGHPNYNFYFSPYKRKDYAQPSSAYSHVLVALKCDNEGRKWTDVVTFPSADRFRLLYNLSGDACYQFNTCQFQDLKEQRIPAKSVFRSDCNLKGMLDYNQRLLEMDSTHALISIRPDISLCMVPPDITQDVASPLCQGQSDEFQLFFQQYIQVLTQRHHLFSSSGQKQRYFFSRTGMYYFLKHGKSRANVFGLRDLTVEERRRVLEGILTVANSAGSTSFHLLSNELNYNNYTYLLYGTDTLIADSYPGFRNYDPTQDYDSCWIHSPNIAQSFSYFADHQLLSRYAHSQEQTADFIAQLLQQPL